jgi:putative membrane protein
LACLVPWPLLSATVWPSQIIFAIQIGVFIAALLLFGLTPLGVALLPRVEQRRQAFRQATEQFFTRGVGRTHSRAGVLIFVSLAERYARILADEGLTGKISEQQWREVMDALTNHLRANRPTEGFVAAIESCGALLGRVAPPDGDGNELPDSLVQLD